VSLHERFLVFIGVLPDPRHEPTEQPAARKETPRVSGGLAQIVGFLAGFIGVGALLIAFSNAAGLQPRGPGWLVLLFGAGIVGSRVGIHLTNVHNLQRMGEHWWKLDQTLRLVLVVGVVWAVTLLLLLRETNLKVVLLPPLALVVLLFAYRFLVERPEDPPQTPGT
jgi:hypothetical protein